MTVLPHELEQEMTCYQVTKKGLCWRCFCKGKKRRSVSPAMGLCGEHAGEKPIVRLADCIKCGKQIRLTAGQGGTKYCPICARTERLKQNRKYNQSHYIKKQA